MSAYDMDHFPYEVGTDCQQHFEGHVKRCQCCSLTLSGSSHSQRECERRQPSQHPSANCQRHIQHIQNCDRCSRKRLSWELSSSRAFVCRFCYASVLVGGIVAHNLRKPETRLVLQLLVYGTDGQCYRSNHCYGERDDSLLHNPTSDGLARQALVFADGVGRAAAICVLSFALRWVRLLLLVCLTWI